ncbi:tRNA pseudouridine(55) synthase TruB [Aeromicrobium sp. YIM 150415]|uniref:tRNA pseudouridine(55) synthase TruB n=1 Tax=Aeromicrobium sp. YIM 150415 TaxID=2803912 RepID=UPI0019657DD0|nr:tRNA pseudouridine(55) synthase TruB [Aeromicrobium sp. YIM 150415]MBM9462732.1 tRNA pseudouridine(55) synthase TruB [Aeromicrobium sp. YIM 150415]
MTQSSAPGGLAIVDKPAGWTSHDVVGRMRRLAQTRKVGHAGTLDPMATGVLVLGIGRATRLLGHLQLADKEYLATIRLGESTVTDDAEGEVVTTADASGLVRDEIEAAMRPLTGEIEQVPSKVSAIKIDGRRSYARVRAGEDVEIPARPVTVSTFEVTGVRPAERTIDVDVRVACSSGTYVRALARDLGDALGVGGHLTMLRRTRVGGFGIDRARTLDQLAERWEIVGLDDAARAAFEILVLDEDQSRLARHGRALEDIRLPSVGVPTALFGADGRFLALYEQRGAAARAVAVFV